MNGNDAGPAVLHTSLQSETWELRLRKLPAYLELTKPRVTLLLLLVAVAGFWMGSMGALDIRRLLSTAAGIVLLAAGIFALNQYAERGLDAAMRRTANRPLPAGRLSPGEALCFGVTASVAAVASLTLLVNPLSGLLASLTLASYLFLYTPLKTKTPHCTLIGAFPGAMPPLIGWAAVRGELSGQAWILFAILFLWQFPHFHSIAWLYREDYARANICLWPVVEPEGRTTGYQVVGFTCLLLPVSLLPWLLGLAGEMYGCAAILLGALFLDAGIRAARARTQRQAQRLLMASVLYLPVLFLFMVLGSKH